MRYADFAMYKVKHSVKGELSDFDLETYNNETYRLQNKAELNELIEKQAVQFHFQPIVDAKTGEIFAYEALMRAHMSTLKTPDEIFTLARLEFKLNQMETIAWFKSMEAFTALARENGITEEQKIFINSVPNHIVPEDKLKVFEEQYRHYLQRIVLEITEEEEQQEDICEKKKDLLKRWGAQVALDDYGSGYNSEKALLGLAPHFIKVDLSIIRNINTDRDKQKIVENIVSYAHERICR